MGMGRQAGQITGFYLSAYAIKRCTGCRLADEASFQKPPDKDYQKTILYDSWEAFLTGGPL